MHKVRILIVEDEAIIAKNLQSQLEKKGYEVPHVLATGEEAVETAGKGTVDLVLMDIVLLGEMDGIEAASQIRAKYDLPVIYLTAYADEAILERAKMTEPFGYLIKPFEDRELHSAIQMALYNHKMEQTLKEKEKWLSTILNSIGDAVIATDTESHVIFINPVASTLTGWKEDEAKGKVLDDIFSIISEKTGEQIVNPVKRVLRDGVFSSLSDHTKLVTRDTSTISIDATGTPIIDDKNDVVGVVLIFHDITERKAIEEELKQKVDDLEHFYEMAIGRELKMKELKSTIAKMDKKLSQLSSDQFNS